MPVIHATAAQLVMATRATCIRPLPLPLPLLSFHCLQAKTFWLHGLPGRTSTPTLQLCQVRQLLWWLCINRCVCCCGFGVLCEDWRWFACPAGRTHCCACHNDTQRHAKQRHNSTTAACSTLPTGAHVKGCTPAADTFGAACQKTLHIRSSYNHNITFSACRHLYELPSRGRHCCTAAAALPALEPHGHKVR